MDANIARTLRLLMDFLFRASSVSPGDKCGGC
jgi:hypothetical protein